MRAYRASELETKNPIKAITDTDLWSVITRGYFKPMLQLVERDDAEGLSRYLVKFGSEYMWFGGLSTWIDGFNHWDTSDQAVAESYFDTLLSLAEAVGALTAENPEQGENGNWGRNQLRSVEEVGDLISGALGLDLAPPTGVIATAGLPYRGKLLHYRHLNALYAASRVRDLIGPQDAVAEFGGGLGLVAFYLNLFARRNITLFDIPISNVLSGFFLIGALGDDAVRLEGEAMCADAVKIRANWAVAEVPDQFAAALNQDSFAEINARILDAYIRHIARTTTGYILSINHEVKHAIVDGVRHLNVSRRLGTEPWLRRVYRSPYWLRRGYVEELYAVAVLSSQG
jgi:hypothetical protein